MFTSSLRRLYIDVSDCSWKGWKKSSLDIFPDYLNVYCTFEQKPWTHKDTIVNHSWVFSLKLAASVMSQVYHELARPSMFQFCAIVNYENWDKLNRFARVLSNIRNVSPYNKKTCSIDDDNSTYWGLKPSNQLLLH